MAVPPADVIAKRISIVLLFKNSIGKILRLVVVKIVKTCWRPKMMNKIPEHTNNPMIFPEFQG